MTELINLTIDLGRAGYYSTMEEIGRLTDKGSNISKADRARLTALRKAVSTYVGFNLEDEDPID